MNVRDLSPEARREVFRRIIKAGTVAAREKAIRKEKRIRAADNKFLRGLGISGGL